MNVVRRIHNTIKNILSTFTYDNLQVVITLEHILG